MLGGQNDPKIDQAAWQALTTWADAHPDALRFSELILSRDLPERFGREIALSKHPFVRQLRLRSRRPVPRASWNNRFANLVSGRFTEILFFRAYSASIAKLGLGLRSTVERRDWMDYLIEDEATFELAINVKNAGVQFRQAAQFVGLDFADTLPIATYKIFGSSEREDQIPLVYVYLVDWTLISRLRAAYWTALSDPERNLFRLITTFKGMPRQLEDAFIEATIADRVADLAGGAGYDLNALDQLPFRAISGARCKAIFYENRRRSPYVFRQRMQTDPNVHISVSRETIHFPDFIEQWLATAERRRMLMAGLRQTKTIAIPNPPV